jgi:hypothetical protein
MPPRPSNPTIRYRSWIVVPAAYAPAPGSGVEDGVRPEGVDERDTAIVAPAVGGCSSVGDPHAGQKRPPTGIGDWQKGHAVIAASSHARESEVEKVESDLVVHLAP